MKKFQTKNSNKKFLCTAEVSPEGKFSDMTCHIIPEYVAQASNSRSNSSYREKQAEQFTTLQEDTVNKNIPRQVNFNYNVTYNIWPFMFHSSSEKNTFKDFQTGKKTRYGTLKGIEEKLDYIEYLGCKNILLGPITKCWEGGMDKYINNRYQTINWETTQPQLGSPEDLRHLCREAHKRGMKILQDFTFNHSSYQHPFYLKALGFNSSHKERAYYRKWFIFESFSSDGSVNNNPFDPNGPYASYVKNILITKYGIPTAFFNTNGSGNLIPGYFNDPNGYAWDEAPFYFMQLTDNPSQANSIQSNLVPPGSDLVGKWVMHFPFAENLIQLNWIDYPRNMLNYFVEVMKFWLSLGIDGFRWDVAQNYYVFNSSGNDENYFKKITEKLIAFKPNFIAFAEGNYQGGFFAPYTLGVQQDLFGALVRGGAFGGGLSFPNVNNQNLISILIDQFYTFYNTNVSMTLLGNHDIGRLASIYQYLPPDYNPYTDLSVQDIELRNVSFFTLLLCCPGSPMIFYGEELAEIGSTYAQCRDYFKWSQKDYDNGICDTYNGGNVFPQQTRGDGLINPGDPNDTTTPLNHPYTRGLDIQSYDPNSSFNQIRELIKIRNNNSILQKGELLNLDSGLASQINLVVNNASPDSLEFVRYYNDGYVFVIINQDPNNTGNVATITFDSNYNNDLLNISYMVDILFTNGNALIQGQTFPNNPQNEVHLAPWQSLVIGYNNNPIANF